MSQRSTCDTGQQSTREYSVDSAISEHARFPPPPEPSKRTHPYPHLACDVRGWEPHPTPQDSVGVTVGAGAPRAKPGRAGAHVYRTYYNTLIR